MMVKALFWSIATALTTRTNSNDSDVITAAGAYALIDESGKVTG